MLLPPLLSSKQIIAIVMDDLPVLAKRQELMFASKFKAEPGLIRFFNLPGELWNIIYEMAMLGQTLEMCKMEAKTYRSRRRRHIWYSLNRDYPPGSDIYH